MTVSDASELQPRTLDGKRAVVTGASLGIGRAAAQALAERGAEVMLVARTTSTLMEALESLAGTGHEAHAFDVSDERGWREMLAGIERIDALVCAAAVIEPIGAIGSYSPSAFRRAVEINLVGTYLGIHHCLPALRNARGSIVTFGGGGATAPQPRYDAYAASKAAVARLTENLAPSLLPHGITINCVAPGFVLTRMHDATLAAGPERAGSDYFELTRKRVDDGAQPISEAAALVCHLVAGVSYSGKIVSAQWDPWRERAFEERLATDSVFGVVRRIDGMQFDVVRERS